MTFIGHSLGGSLSSLLGATFGAPVVAFEAPGDKLAATRLHLPLPVNIIISGFRVDLNVETAAFYLTHHTRL